MIIAYRDQKNAPGMFYCCFDNLNFLALIYLALISLFEIGSSSLIYYTSSNLVSVGGPLFRNSSFSAFLMFKKLEFGARLGLV